MKFTGLIAAVCLSVLALPVHAVTKTITLIHLNDLHAHLIPHKDLVSDGNGGTVIATRGGLTRITSLVKQLRRENPDSILMNVGDTFHGGVEALFSAGNSIVGPVNALGIDVGVAGNWDYYYTPGVTRARYGRVDTNMGGLMNGFFMPGMDSMAPVLQPNYPNLAANMRDITDFMGEFMPATHMIEINGVKVGFIGLTSDIVEDMHPMLAMGFDFTQGESAHRDLVNRYARELRNQGAHIVAVLSELGIHKSKRLADIIDAGSVDFFFCGHTHEVTRVPVDSNSGALVVEAGNDGYLGRMDVTVDVRKRWRSTTVTVQSTQWTLLDVDDSVAEDPEMRALVDAERAQYLGDTVFIEAPPFVMQTLTQSIDTVIGHADSLVDRKDSLESSFNNGWTDLLRQITGTEIAITPGFRMGATIAGTGSLYEDGAVADGAITVEDAYRFFPMAYSISTATVSGSRLKEIIEDTLTRTYSPDIFKQRGGWTFGFSGLNMDLDLGAADGSRIQSLRYAGSDAVVRDSDTLSVTGCRRTPVEYDNTLCSYEGFDNITPVIGGGPGGFDALPIQAVELFQQALASNVFDGSRVSINDSSNTPRWPADTFIQPLDGVGTATGSNGASDDCGFFSITCSGNSFGGFGFMGF